MASELEVSTFLNEIKAKLNTWGITGVVFVDSRSKNTQALLDLDITREDRFNLLKKLEVKDYSEGPKKEEIYGGNDMWVFGKEMKGKEIYIKIALGMNGSKVICISFHVAEHKMSYPLKKL